MKYEINEKKKTVVCIIEAYNRQYVGKAKCSGEDEWNVEKGKKIALLRAREKELKDKIENMNAYRTCVQEIAYEAGYTNSMFNRWCERDQQTLVQKITKLQQLLQKTRRILKEETTIND